jgi:CheY-like chemotaxis protein
MTKVIEILLVEDDQLDVIDIQRSLDKMNILYQLDVAKNGEEALELLDERRKSASELPDVVLIDINMPRMNGLEFLTAVRKAEDLKHLKCFIVTTSAEREDKITAQNLGVSGYIVKPLKLNNPASMDSFNLMIDLMNLKN